MNACVNKSSGKNHRKNRVGATVEAWQGDRMNAFTATAKLTFPVTGVGLKRMPCRPFQDAKLQSYSLDRSGLMTLDLPPGKAFALKLNEGLLWVTMAGDATDYLLESGQTVRFSRPGKLVIEALAGSEFAWEEFAGS